ncbi:hypothetical protein BBP40_007354 [Aspergillus hancockii]|nr:hypothetical protein BBP40_007354 [Aspergillus hancockii]
MSFRQGANNAVKDAAAFVAVMKRVQSQQMSLVDAVLEYETDIFKWGHQAVRLSSVQTYAAHNWGEMLVALEKAGGIEASIAA